jgi:hypothetical protein
MVDLPSRKDAVLNSIGAMFQFRGGIPAIISKFLILGGFRGAALQFRRARECLRRAPVRSPLGRGGRFGRREKKALGFVGFLQPKQAVSYLENPVVNAHLGHPTANPVTH